MSIDLNNIGMKIGQHYECIISTKNEAGKGNAAPIGIRVSEDNSVSCMINSFTHTLKNIKKEEKFIVNITNNPIIFAKSTIGKLPNEYFENYKDMVKLKECEAFFVCKVTLFSELNHKNHIGEHKVGMVKSEVLEIKKNRECVNPLNRAFFAILDSLVLYTRLEVFDKKDLKLVLDKIEENKRLIEKVGSSEDKETIDYISQFIEEKKTDLNIDN